MNGDDRVEAALRHRPSDERIYDEPVRALAEGSAVGARRARGAVPALAGLCLVLLLAAGVAILGPRIARDQSDNSSGFEITGRVGCFGQGPGFTPGSRPEATDECPMMAVPPAGYGPATWTLDPSVPYSAGSTEIHVLVAEWACHGFETADGRIVQSVQDQGDSVAITLAVRALEGAHRCPGTPPTPYVVHLERAVGDRDLLDGGEWPARLIARAGAAIVTPSPTPYPPDRPQPIDCSPDVDAADFFKAAAMTAWYDVYCAVLPAGWSVTQHSDPALAASQPLTIEYHGPAGETFYLWQGKYCEATGSGTICDRLGPDLGTAMLGDRPGRLGGANGSFYVYTAPDNGAMWTVSCTGMSLDAFKSLAAALIDLGSSGPTASSSAAPARTFMAYRVMNGDTINSIAAKFGISREALLAANPRIENPNLILVGEVIYIPWQGWVPPSA